MTERPDAHVIRQELAQALQAAIEELPADQRITLVLADVEGLDYLEIAQATGAALGTVKSRLSRARAKMRDMLLAQKELLPAQYRLPDVTSRGGTS
jgi:RNA polymerase sigma-70 factor (ECF subfamily)